MKIKGPVFPSFKEPPHSLFFKKPAPPPHRSLPEGKAWIAHSGESSRVRRLRQSCRLLLSSNVPSDVALIAKAHELISKGPHHEYGVLMILYKAQETATQNDLSWQESLEYILEGLKTDPPLSEPAS